jgi:hypothetical protein
VSLFVGYAKLRVPFLPSPFNLLAEAAPADIRDLQVEALTARLRWMLTL